MPRWPLNTAYFWERAPFFRFLLPLAAGIVLYACGGGHLSITVISSIAAVSVAGFCVVAYAKRSHYRSVTGFFLFHLAVVSMGWLLCYGNDIRTNRQWFGNTVAKGSKYVVQLMDDPQLRAHSYRLPVQVIGAQKDDKMIPTSGKALLYVSIDYTPVNYHAGDTLLVNGQWECIKNAGNPYEFDYAGYCAQHNLYYQLYTKSKNVRLFAKGSSTSYTQQAHRWCMQQLESYLKDSTTRGLIQSMLLGDDVNLDKDLKTAYAQTGIIHIIAISGSNVGILFLLVAALLWWLKHKRYQWIKYCLALPLVWFYVLMAGAEPSAIRAAIMFSLLALGILLQRNPNSLNQLMATAVVLLCAQPMWLFAVGFQLSFVAVLSLILFYRPIRRWVQPAHKFSRGLWNAVAASIAAEVLTAPLVIYYFHLFPLFFVVANALAFLFMGIVLVLGMLIILFSGTPTIATALAWVTKLLCTAFNTLVYRLQHINPPAFNFLQLSGVELLLLYLLIAGIAVFLLQKNKPGLFTGLAAGCSLLSLLCTDEWTALHQQRLVVYNIPQTVYTEVIRGNTYNILVNDSIHQSQSKDYQLLGTHTHWHAWQQAAHDTNTIITIGSKKALILHAPLRDSASFPVDYLVLNCLPRDMPPTVIQQLFHPQKIILGNYPYDRTTLQQWRSQCTVLHMPVYSVADSGAFVLNAF